jgi:hypothetical protein
MTALGLAITFLTVLVLAVEFVRHKLYRFPAYGWAGLTMLLLAEGLLFRGVRLVDIYFTPIAWTAYLLIADSMVFALTGRSRLNNSPRRFLLMALVSIPLWLIFEGYNLRLRNWTYVGLPMHWAGALLGYGWSFATITPAILETADLVEAFGWFKSARPLRFSENFERAMIVFGAFCLIVPLVFPQPIAARWFVMVWLGFIFLLDPINRRLGFESLLGDLAQGRRSRFYSLLVSGWICGWLWEFWNYWAAAKWYYIFPMFQQWKIFEMPIPGYLGFLPFALECFVMYVAATSALPRIWKSTV